MIVFLVGVCAKSPLLSLDCISAAENIWVGETHFLHMFGENLFSFFLSACVCVFRMLLWQPSNEHSNNDWLWNEDLHIQHNDRFERLCDHV